VAAALTSGNVVCSPMFFVLWSFMSLFNLGVLHQKKQPAFFFVLSPLFIFTKNYKTPLLNILDA
jgi:hypothetical protein